MKIFVKTPKGTDFEIEANSDDSVADLKKSIEKAQGADVYPAASQMLIHQEKVLKDDTTLGENNVVDNSFLVIMLSKNMPATAGASSVSAAPPTQGIPEQAEVAPMARTPAATTGGQPANPLFPAGNPVGQAGNPLAQVGNPLGQAPQTAVPASGPNASPLDLFPQGIPGVGSIAGAGSLDFLRNSQHFQAFRAMVQANPQILQPMLQELGKQNPQLMRLIQENQTDFLRLINEPVEEEGNLLSQLASSMPPTVSVTPEEREAIERKQTTMAAKASRSATGSADSYPGRLISLTSKSDIRYDGILFNINTDEASIRLRNVRCFGTEGRRKDGLQVPASDKVYEYIVFRGSDIKDLQVKSSPPVQTSPPVHSDPAIIQSCYTAPTASSAQQSVQYPTMSSSLPTGASNVSASQSVEFPPRLLQPIVSSTVSMLSYVCPDQSSTLAADSSTNRMPSLVPAQAVLSQSTNSPLVPPVISDVLDKSTVGPLIPNQAKPLSSTTMPINSFSESLSASGGISTSPALVTPGQLLQPGPTISQNAPTEQKDVEVVQVSAMVSSPQPSSISSTAADALGPADAQAPLLPLPSPSNSKLPLPVPNFMEDFDFEAVNEKFKKDGVWGHLGKNKAKADDGLEFQDEDDVDVLPIDSKAKRLHPNDPDEKNVAALSSLEVPLDVALEIFLHLPVQSLLRCKVVCRDWKLIISSSHFALSYLKRKKADTAVHSLLFGEYISNWCLFIWHSNEPFHRRFICSEFLEEFSIIGACNGLFCLVSHLRDIIILNPATRNEVHVGRPSHSNFSAIGFGWDGDRDHKVLVVTMDECNHRLSVMVYSVTNATWKDLGWSDCIFGESSLDRNDTDTLLLNDDSFLVWVGADSRRIFTFDFCAEIFGEVLLPTLSYEFDSISLGLVGDQFAVMVRYPFLSPLLLDIWIKDGEQWSIFYSLPADSDTVVHRTGMPMDDSIPLGFRVKGLIVDMVSYDITFVMRPIRFHIEDKPLMADKENIFGGFTFFTQVESLF